MDQATFDADDRTPDAGIRRLEILGEAAGKVGDAFREGHDEIPWRVLRDVRNLLIHGYEDVALDRVWVMATEDVPALLATLESLLAGP